MQISQFLFLFQIYKFVSTFFLGTRSSAEHLIASQFSERTIGRYAYGATSLEDIHGIPDQFCIPGIFFIINNFILSFRFPLVF